MTGRRYFSSRRAKHALSPSLTRSINSASYSRAATATISVLTRSCTEGCAQKIEPTLLLDFAPSTAGWPLWEGALRKALHAFDRQSACRRYGAAPGPRWLWSFQYLRRSSAWTPQSRLASSRQLTPVQPCGYG